MRLLLLLLHLLLVLVLLPLPPLQGRRLLPPYYDECGYDYGYGYLHI